MSTWIADWWWWVAFLVSGTLLDLTHGIQDFFKSLQRLFPELDLSEEAEVCRKRVFWGRALWVLLIGGFVGFTGQWLQAGVLVIIVRVIWGPFASRWAFNQTKKVTRERENDVMQQILNSPVELTDRMKADLEKTKKTGWIPPASS